MTEDTRTLAPWAMELLTRPVWALPLHAHRLLLAVAQGAATPQAFLDEFGGDPDEGKNRPGVAVLSLRGVLTPGGGLLSLLFGTPGGLTGFQQRLREAVDDEGVRAIVLDIDSPGGSVALLQETGEQIKAAKAVKPVVAVANTWAASAAYYLASQASELVVTPSGEVGSIGTVIVHEDWSQWNERVGVNPTYITAGKYKAEANPDNPLTDDARQALQDTVDSYYDDFLRAVADGRGVTPDEVRDRFGQGRMVRAEPAVELGMADRVATIDETITRLLEDEPEAPTKAAPSPVGAPKESEPQEGHQTDEVSRLLDAYLAE